MAEQVIHSHWHQSIAALTITPTEFYEAVGQAIMRRNIPGVTIKGEYFSEGMIGSAQRLYLRARRGEYLRPAATRAPRRRRRASDLATCS